MSSDFFASEEPRGSAEPPSAPHSAGGHSKRKRPRSWRSTIVPAVAAVALAGGTKVTSSLKGTKILRTTPDGIQEIPIPLNKILEAKAEDPPLKAEDVLFVPNSPGKVAAITGAQAAISVATGLAIYRP